jgi:hypothetical protein
VSTNAIWFGVIFTLLVYGTRASFRTFRREMEIDANVWLMVICMGIIAFYYIVTRLV